MEVNSGGIDCNSQEMSCCRSLSPPSEPPHIGNWFSSYEYESPDVDFGDAAMGFISGDVKLRKLGSLDDGRDEKSRVNSKIFGQYRKRKLVQECDKNNSAETDDDGETRRNHNMDSVNVISLSMPSEPPDIRNWFSSYVYESPELVTGTSVNLSVSGEVQLDQQDISNKLNSPEQGINKENRRTCRNEKDGTVDLSEGRSPLESSDVNDVCYTNSVSLPSEPPDIENWFSSYVYESPELFTDGKLELPFVEEIQSGDCDGNIVMRNGRKVDGDISNTSLQDREILMDLMPSHNHGEADTSQGNCRVEQSDKNSNCFPNLFDQIVEETLTQSLNHSTSDMEKLVDKTDPQPSTNKTFKRLLHRKSFIAKHSAEKATAANPVSLVTEVVQLIKNPGMSFNSFQRGVVFEQVDDSIQDKNGFVSTKKNRRTLPNQDNLSFLRKQQMPAAVGNHFGITKQVQGSSMRVGSKRDAMSDVTNTQHSIEQEISGKWKCPQRSKSNVQPPMKQLRLGQWVTREGDER